MEFAGITDFVPSPNRVNTVFSPLATRQVTKEHPRLFGSRAYLQGLAKERPEAYRRTKEIANRELTKPPHPADATGDFGAQVSVESKLFSMALVAAIEEDAVMGRKVVDFVFEHFINQPVRVGHVPFGADVGNAAIGYDLCNEHWTAEEKKRFEAYMFECRDKNVDQELSPFHDGWWGYKNWGFVLGTLALMGESQQEMLLLYQIDREFRYVAADALRAAGDGGGYAEGFYVNYYMYHWLLACEAMKRCTGADWLAEAPGFYGQRAIASAFEQYPTIRERGSRRMICVGDGRGRFFKVERDAILTSNNMLVGIYKNDPAHQAIKAFLELTPHVGADENAYRELLWFDPKIKKGNLKKFKLSHASKGPGYVYARSSWDEDATYFFFKCGKRFTAHQHIDVGHFFIFKHEELATEGGHYAGYGDHHDCNYYNRTISHNSMLIHDPNETWSFMRGYAGPTFNDGGQSYPWPGTSYRHNGEPMDMDAWRRHPELGDIAELLAFQDAGTFMYTAGDCTRAYSPKKLETFTRQIVFIRPGTFVIFDRVKSKDASFKKTWLLQAAKEPTGDGKKLVVTHGKGRLHVQSVLPAEVEVKLNQGADLYKYGVEGQDCPPESTYGPAAECRIEISPVKAAKEDVFLHVLTATDAGVENVPEAKAEVKKGKVVVTIGKTKVTFLTDKVGGSIEIKGKKTTFANKVLER
ncbi:MAG: heparinase II/III family protein [Phycisphaerales bacterium]|nr:heparinase II/III family protein [Phycisphaerales bacterium]